MHFGDDPPANNQQDDTSDRLGLLAGTLGVAAVPTTGQNSFNPAGSQATRQAGCFCHPSNQECPAGTQTRGTQRRTTTSNRIANAPGEDCPGQKVCCSGGATNLPIQRGPSPAGPIIQQDCGVQGSFPRSPNPLEASFGEFPWMTVILEQNNKFIGGGALISNDWILTAAHKVQQYISRPQSLKIRIGDFDVSRADENPQFPHVEVAVQQIIIHPQFDPSKLSNDVALLRLSRPVDRRNSPHIERVCLPDQGQTFSPQRCWVTGWGEESFQGGNVGSTGGGKLNKVDVPIWDPFVCQERLREAGRDRPSIGPNYNLDMTSWLCAGGEPGKDACSGDGGAPLVCEGSDGRFAVVGLVAWGLGCGQQNVPGVYVNVPSYVSFIRQNTGI